MFTGICYRIVANNVYVAGSFPFLHKLQLKEIPYSYSVSTFANSCPKKFFTGTESKFALSVQKSVHGKYFQLVE